MEAKSVGATGFNVMIFLIFLFLYVPMAILVIFSFNDGLFPSPWQGFTVKWYSELFHSPAVWDAFYNSLIVAVSATCLSLLFALGLVYYESHERMIGSWVYLFYGTIFVPEVVLAIGLLSFLSFCSVPLGLTTLIAGHTLLGLGYAVPTCVCQLSPHMRKCDTEQNERKLNNPIARTTSGTKIVP